jgi:hypothetical protein
VPSVTVTIKSNPKHDLGNDREEGVITEIDKYAKCYNDDESYLERDSENDGRKGVTTEINKQLQCDIRD